MEFSTMMDLDQINRGLMEYAQSLGADYVALLYQEEDSGSITVENGVLRIFEDGKASGLGVRVLLDGALGHASSTKISSGNLKESIEYAVKMAKASGGSIERVYLSAAKPQSESVASTWKKNHDDFSNEEKLKLVLEANKGGSIDGIVSSTTSIGWLTDRRLFESSEGSRVETQVQMTGLSQHSVAGSEGRLESVSDSKSLCSGFEFLTGLDMPEFCEGISKVALEALRAVTPPSGKYDIVADPKLVGLIFHEAMGHASEGDLVAANESVLEGQLGRTVASSLVTIVDQGMVDGGYFMPYDDEGVEKGRDVVVEKGVLMNYLHSRSSAHKLGALSTGNARSSGFGDKPLVRQTNFFVEVGDESFEELLEDVHNGLYLLGRGARGGEVDVGQGTFTFSAGPSYVIEKGEITEMVRGVSIGGMVLEALNNVSGVGKDLVVETSIFGGCGKGGQRARVGHGGPHVRMSKIAVGGRA